MFVVVYLLVISSVLKFNDYSDEKAKNGRNLGSDGGSVASNTEVLQFESSHWQILFSFNCQRVRVWPNFFYKWT